MIADLTKEEKTENLEDKRRLLELLRKRMDFADIQKAYDNWRFSDLVGDSDFKRMYEDQAVKEREKPDSEYFEENIGKYIKLVEEGKEITSRYFGKWKVNFQAYCEEINNNRVLNVNLIHYDKSEPTRISDILQQEKDIKELNIYCNKKHEIYAHQEGKKRYYEIKEGACYKMISTWPVENGSRMCTMIMNVSSDGITEVLKFNGKDFVPSEEILELIKQNDELYIQGLVLHDAVMKSLEKGKLPDVVPVANNDLQSNESIRVNKDGGQGDLENGASTPSFTDESTQTEETLPDVVPVANSDTSTQMEVDLQQPETQTEIDLQQIDWLLSENCKLRGENAELMESNEQLEDKIVILEGKLKKETQRNIKLQAELEQKNEGLASALAEEQKMEEGLKSMREEKRKLKEELKIVNAGKKNLEKELNQAREDAEQIMVEQRQQKERLKDQLRELDQEYQEYKVQKESDRQDSDLQDTLGEERLKLNIEELENEYEEFPGDKVLTLELTKDEDKVEESRNELERKKEKCKQLLEEENEWGDELVGMLNGLKEKIRADGQRSLNDQFYTLTGNISSEPDNAPQKKSGLSKSLSLDNESYVPLREKTHYSDL